MANQCFAHISGIQVQVIDMAGHVSPGGQILYDAIVLDAANNPVTYLPGALAFNVVRRPVAFTVNQILNLNKAQTAVIADILALYNDPSIQVTFI